MVKRIWIEGELREMVKIVSIYELPDVGLVAKCSDKIEYVANPDMKVGDWLMIY